MNLPDAPGLSIIECSPAQLLATASRHIVQAHPADRPDFTRISVVLPQLHARAAFARALQAQVGDRVVLLPRVTTLRSWAAETGTGTALPAPVREALIYQALSERQWFDNADLWAVAAELSALFDELTRWRVGLPASIADFSRRLERAYQAVAGASFDFEARLVHELWHALASGPGRIDAEAAYQLGLAQLARALNGPLYAVGLGRLPPAEAAFFERCAERVAVVRVVSDTGSPAALPLAERILARAWPAQPTSSLRERADELRALGPGTGLTDRVRFFGANGGEQEAVAIDVSVRQWLIEGRKTIAVVVLDRVVARRARALLERAEVLVRDEVGWALSTTSAATVVGRWFDVLGNDFYHRDLLDLLKSPFAFCDWPRSARQQAVWRLERKLRTANVAAGLEGYLALADSGNDAELRQMLLRVQRGARALDHGRRKTLSGWLGALARSLTGIGVTEGLQADAAGIELLDLLAALTRDLADSTMLVGFGEFRRWLAARLEGATFRDAGIDSPVVFTSLDASRLRHFDAVLIAGADASHLPGGDAAGLFFNQAVRRDLGLPGPAERMRELEESLSGLICGSGEVLVSWQHMRDGEANLLAPVFERLRTLHKLAWDASLDDRELAQRIRRAGPGAADPAPIPGITERPAPSAPPDRVPATISASGYNSLMACPYQFHARYVLGLHEVDEVQEEIDKADYGTRVHDILTCFHRRHPRVLDMSAEAAQRSLGELSASAFAGVIAHDYLASAWLARWRALIPGYVEWQRAREAEGWRFHAGEVDRELVLETPAGHTLTLRGRIDRIDAHSDGSIAVIDYKTQAAKRLSEELKLAGENVQLPVYALLWGDEVAAALFLSLDRKEVRAVSIDEEVDALAGETRQRLVHLYDRMMTGASLPAQGIDAVCEYCEMSGLCRRKHWS